MAVAHQHKIDHLVPQTSKFSDQNMPRQTTLHTVSASQTFKLIFNDRFGLGREPELGPFVTPAPDS